MFALTQQLDDPDGNVSKLIFEDGQGAIAETVVYRYNNDRGVVCYSVQSGCPVGCSFCGTGKRFIRDLTEEEIIQQIMAGYRLIADCKKRQYMSMSMGEPMLNYIALQSAISYCDSLGISEGSHFYISTIGINDPYILTKIFEDACTYENYGLQFSLHSPYEEKRFKLLGRYSNLMTLDHIQSVAELFQRYSGRPAYFNYICQGKPTTTLIDDIYAIAKGQHLTLSVMCNTGQFAKGDPAPAFDFYAIMASRHPDLDVTVFDPAGQDTIGGGCGQLLYVQKKLLESTPGDI